MLDPHTADPVKAHSISVLWLILDVLCTLIVVVEMAAKCATRGIACPPWPW